MRLEEKNSKIDFAEELKNSKIIIDSISKIIILKE